MFVYVACHDEPGHSDLVLRILGHPGYGKVPTAFESTGKIGKLINSFYIDYYDISTFSIQQLRRPEVRK